MTSGLFQSSSDTVKLATAAPAMPYDPTTNSDCSTSGRTRQIDCDNPHVPVDGTAYVPSGAPWVAYPEDIPFDAAMATPVAT